MYLFILASSLTVFVVDKIHVFIFNLIPPIIIIPYILALLLFLFKFLQNYGKMYIEVSCINLYGDSFKLSYLSLQKIKSSHQAMLMIKSTQVDFFVAIAKKGCDVV